MNVGTRLIEWLNFSIMIISVIIFAIFYIKSVQPAILEKKIGIIAYKRCAVYRVISGIFMFILIVNQIIYFFFPLPLFIPRYFTWDYYISAIIAICIAIPSLILMIKGIHDAGKETMKPSKEHKLFGGIYEKIRHPQALGEVVAWWIISFFLNSPFLSLFYLIMFPIFFIFCIFEEKDLEIRYGQAYIDYKKRTGMFIPKIKRLKD